MRTTDPAILSIGDRIASARMARGWTQVELAREAFPAKRERTQCCKISYWESGDFTPSLEAVRAIAGALGVTTDWLLGMPGARRKSAA